MVGTYPLRIAGERGDSMGVACSSMFVSKDLWIDDPDRSLKQPVSQ